jgi:hypothetical protein
LIRLRRRLSGRGLLRLMMTAPIQMVNGIIWMGMGMEVAADMGRDPARLRWVIGRVWSRLSIWESRSIIGSKLVYM